MKRWLRFNAVGIAGAAIQLLALGFLTWGLGTPYVLATMAAVEIALLHNFALHELWTWRGCPVEHRWRRLVRFHAANGAVSIASNGLLTWVFARYAGLPLLVANIGAMGITGVVNFLLAEAVVVERANTRDQGSTRPAPGAGSASPSPREF